jgi:hypothetical protein
VGAQLATGKSAKQTGLCQWLRRDYYDCECQALPHVGKASAIRTGELTHEPGSSGEQVGSY